jgi:hypothetical protein
MLLALYLLQNSSRRKPHGFEQTFSGAVTAACRQGAFTDASDRPCRIDSSFVAIDIDGHKAAAIAEGVSKSRDSKPRNSRPRCKIQQIVIRDCRPGGSAASVGHTANRRCKFAAYNLTNHRAAMPCGGRTHEGSMQRKTVNILRTSRGYPQNVPIAPFQFCV